MPVGGNNAYPSIADVDGLVRSLVQDDMAGATGTVGEGQVFVDNPAISVTMQRFFNSALRTLCRKLRTATGPMLIRDNIQILGLPPLVSADQGVAAPNPSVQVQLSFVGYFNGLNFNSLFILPVDCLQVERLWERVNGSNDNYRPMTQCKQGLPSRWQDVYNLEWEWRQDSIWMPGSIETMDLRLRYQAQLPTLYTSAIVPSTTYIPILDSVEPLAGLMIQLIAIRQGPLSVPPQIKEWADETVNDFLNEYTKRDQGMPYQVTEFGGDDGGTTGMGY